MNTAARLMAGLSGHVAVGERESTALEAIREFAATIADPFDRNAGPTHVTASAIVAGPRGTVLHVHKLSGLWLQPGGHVDAGESPADAAVRETLEETGLHCFHPAGAPLLLQVDRHRTSNGHTHLDLCYLVLSEDAEPSAGESESATVRWFPWSDARALADECLASALDRAQRSLAGMPPDRGV